MGGDERNRPAGVVDGEYDPRVSAKSLSPVGGVSATGPAAGSGWLVRPAGERNSPRGRWKKGERDRPAEDNGWRVRPAGACNRPRASVAGMSANLSRGGEMAGEYDPRVSAIGSGPGAEMSTTGPGWEGDAIEAVTLALSAPAGLGKPGGP